MGLVQTEAEGSGPKDREKDREQAGGSLTRITANFTSRAAQSIERVADKTGDSKTDILNKAVMVYEVFVNALERSNGELRVVNPDGTQEVWRLMG
jgi:anti-sigma regulatory factor (Ser/Thr protein kinase)